MRFHGKYRGVVTGNVDPMTRGRVQVSVPSVLGDGRLSWAEPCVPFAGDGVGLFAVPPVGTNVWVEFEGGDSQHPILAGCFWGDGQAPGDGLPTTKVLAVDGITLTLNELSGAGGFTLEVGSPAVSVPMKLSCTADGIVLSIGSSKLLLSTTSVSVNDGALEVM
jgi:Type VI secretion system/phage-baseplate injector OB domain